METFLVNVSTKQEIKLSDNKWSMREFNNIETADRRLIVNNKLEFWVHEEALASNADYFSDLSLRNSSTDNDVNQKENDIPTINVDVPYDNHFFDVLVWIYTKDPKKLRKGTKDFHNFLYFMSLGIFLKMKHEYFETLLNKITFTWKLDYFNDALWSRSVFTFPILARITEEMKTNKYTKIFGM